MYCGYKFLVKPQVMKQVTKVLPLNRILESRMALKLDDLIGKKKEVAQVLDLSKATANNAEEFKKLMEKVPEFKIKPEKLKPEDIKIHDFTRKVRRKKKTKPPTAYQFADPLPEEMRSIRLEDLCPVNIQWNMLTTLRPKSKADTEYFSRIMIHQSEEPKAQSSGLPEVRDSALPKSQQLRLFKASEPGPCKIPAIIAQNKSPRRAVQKSDAPKVLSSGRNRVRRLVELGKLEIATVEKEKKNPDSSFMRKMKNRAGITESRYISCAECGEDFCQKEVCMMFQYENFRREPMVETIGKKEPDQKRGRSTTKSRKKGKTRSKSKRKSSDRSNKPRARGSSKAKKDDKSSPRPKSKSRSRSRTKSKSKAPAVDKTGGEEKVQKKVKVKRSPLGKKKVKVGDKQ